jgi:hypothetical protein
MKHLYFVLLFIMIYPLGLFSQTTALTNDSESYELILGLVVQDEKMFGEAVNILSENLSIEVLYPCQKLQAVYLHVDPSGYRAPELVKIFVEEELPGVSCFIKTTTHETLNAFYIDCYEEIVKYKN